MFEEITGLENAIVTAIDRHKEGKDIPCALVTGVLNDICFRYQMGTYESLKPVDVELPKVDDGGPAMTIVEKNIK